MILVIGNPRSGTKSVSWMLRDAGFHVDHERMGVDGTVSCYYVVQPTYIPHGSGARPPHPGEACFKYQDFDRIVHLIRHPLECIASMKLIVNRPHQEWAVHHGLLEQKDFSHSKLFRMMRMWLKSTLSAEIAAHYTLRIEDVGLREHWFKAFGDTRKPPPIRHMHKRNKKKLTWDDLRKEDEATQYAILQIAFLHGYV